MSSKFGENILDDQVQALLRKLNIPFAPQRPTSGKGKQNDCVDTSITLLKHIIECIAAMHKLLNVFRQESKREVGKTVAFRVTNSFTAELGKTLVYAMTNPWSSNEREQAWKYLVVGREILKHFPEMASGKHKASGKMLIHHAASTASRVFAEETIACILNSHPASASTPDSSGALPLHHAMHNTHASFEIADILLQAYPNGALVKDKSGLTALHWAVTSDQPNAEIVRALIEVYPQAAGERCAKGSTPLHWCVNREDVSIPIMQALMQAAPEAVRVQCNDGWLPIHRCVNHPEPNMEAVNVLIAAYPSGLLVANKDGQLPLHKAVDHEYPSLECVKFLLESCPTATEASDNEGYLPLHITIDCPVPDVLVAERLLRIYPNGAKMTTKDGLLALHIVLSSNEVPHFEFVEMLANAFPDSVRTEALEYRPTDMAAYLQDPEGWNGQWTEYRWTPLSRADERGLTDIHALLRSAIIGNGPSGTPSSTLPAISTKKFTDGTSPRSNGVRDPPVHGNIAAVHFPRVYSLGSRSAPPPADPVPNNLRVAAERTNFLLASHAASGQGGLNTSINQLQKQGSFGGSDTGGSERSDPQRFSGLRVPRRRGSERPTGRWAHVSGTSPSQGRPATDDSERSELFALPVAPDSCGGESTAVGGVDTLTSDGQGIREFTVIEMDDHLEKIKRKSCVFVNSDKQDKNHFNSSGCTVEGANAGQPFSARDNGTIVKPTGLDFGDMV